MSTPNGLADLMKSLDQLGAAEWWNYRSEQTLDYHDLPVRVELARAVTACREAARASGANDEQIEDALSYSRQQVLSNSGRPLMAGSTVQEFLSSLS